MLKVSMRWTGNLAFEGRGQFGHTLITDASREAGGDESGFKPTELLLYGIAGCTGIDIVRILSKQRQSLRSLEIHVEGEQNEDHPKPFHTVRVHYVARGEDLDHDKLARAIELSESKYCVVSQTLEQPTKVSTSFEIVVD
jgi:putative redox protein